MAIFIDIPGIANQNPQNINRGADGPAAVRNSVDASSPKVDGGERVDSFSFGGGAERAGGAVGGGSVGSRSHRDVEVSHGMDRASPKLSGESGVRDGFSAERAGLEGDPDRPRMDVTG